jgi:predicted nucleic acid-binding Zn finger protein
MSSSDLSKEKLETKFAQYSKQKNIFNKAIETVIQNCVKKHIFKPSGRVVYSVVGKSGDEFLDPDKPFCSCSHFFFRVLGGQSEFCYHFLSYKLALESKKIEEITFDDEEYETFMKLIIFDILKNIKDKGDKDS